MKACCGPFPGSFLPSVSQRERRSLMRPTSRSLSLAAALACGITSPALAGWTVDPVGVRPTSASIPQVAACNDGRFGSFVAWQEEATVGSGVLRVHHVVPTGDLDPAWPGDGTLACQRVAGRTMLGALPDRLGGVFVWWTESNGSANVCVNRLEPDGNVAAGWPSDGLSLGVVYNSWLRPSVIEDGAHGLFLAWTSGTSVHAHHLGPNGLAAGGWPSAGRVVVPVDPATTYHLWPDLALADDGGVFLSWATWSWDTTVVESGMHLRRLTGAGLNSAGWPPEGISLAGFRPEPLGAVPGPPLLDIHSDGRGGVFAA